MRTKHILTALVLPALFAACTADDFNEPITGNGVADRALLSEDFKLYVGGADTRFSAGEPGEGLEFAYEVGDTIGGAIADEFVSTETDPVKRFPVKNYISTNESYVLNAQGEWISNDPTTEGHYLFYFPYNRNNRSREAVSYNIPMMQDLSDPETGEFNPKAAVERYNMGVGMEFLDKDAESANLQLVNIFGYAKLQITLDNHYAKGNVDKIVLQANSEAFTLSDQISNLKVWNLYNPDATTSFAKQLEGMTETSDFCIASGDDNYDAEKAVKSVVMGAIAPEGTELDVDGQNNKYFETYIVMPAKDTKYTVNIYLYTTDGDIYKAENVSFEIARNKVTAVEADVTETDDIVYVVTSEKDWNQYVSLLKKTDKAEFMIADENFAITNTTEFPTNGAEITVKGDLKVSGNNVVDMQSITVEEGTLVIEEGAKLTTNGTIEADEVENNGALVIAPALDDDDKVELYKKLGTINNMPGASIVVEEEAEATFLLFNKVDNETKEMVRGTLENNGELTLKKGSINKGEITNNGILGGSFTNAKEVACADNSVKAEDRDDYNFTPIITNNKEIYVVDGEVVNYGDIENVKGAEISCNRTNGTFNNKGYINVAEGSSMLITDNTGGEVILNAIDQTEWTIQEGQGVVAYRVSEAMTKAQDFKNTGINKLYVAADAMISNYDDIENITVEADAELTLPKYDSKATTTTTDLKGTLLIEKGAAVVLSSESAQVDNLEVEEDARLNIYSNNALTVATVENAGIVYVAGKFTATETTKEDAVVEDGEFRAPSASDEDNNIIFGQTSDEKGEAAVKTALTNLVSVWVENASAMDAKTSWDDVTANAIATGSTWDGTLSTQWAQDAKKAVADAYKAWKGTEPTSVATLISTTYKETVDAAIASAKKAADAELATAIKALDNSWVSTTVYEKKAADAKLAEITDEDGNKMSEKFAGYVKDTYANTLTDKAMKLSAKNYAVSDKATESDFPAYSFIETYEEADVYKAAMEWKKACKESAITSASWYTTMKGSDETGVFANAADMNDMKAFFNAANMAYTDAVTTGDKLQQKLLKPFTTMVDDVLDWEYTPEQMGALCTIVNNAD